MSLLATTIIVLYTFMYILLLFRKEHIFERLEYHPSEKPKEQSLGNFFSRPSNYAYGF